MGSLPKEVIGQGGGSQRRRKKVNEPKSRKSRVYAIISK
jgi:hypothetical protein